MMADTNERASVEERYGVATSTSNLRVDVREGSPVSSADVIWAAGLSDSDLGNALMRLRDEWDHAAKPRAATPRAIKALALTMKGAGGKPDIMRARREAAAWYSSELRLLAQSLKSRAEVLGELTQWAAMKGIGGDLVSLAVHHFLDSTCPHCVEGLRKVPVQPALSARRCNACDGHGQKHAPDGTERVLIHIAYSIQLARNSLKRRLRP